MRVRLSSTSPSLFDYFLTACLGALFACLGTPFWLMAVGSFNVAGAGAILVGLLLAGGGPLLPSLVNRHYRLRQRLILAGCGVAGSATTLTALLWLVAAAIHGTYFRYQP